MLVLLDEVDLVEGDTVAGGHSEVGDRSEDGDQSSDDVVHTLGLMELSAVDFL